MTKVLVLGVDSAEPSLVFGEWLKELPTINHFVKSGVWGFVKTTVPPITCPAWVSALTGLNPGYLGLYDLKYKKPGTYVDFGIVNSRMVFKPRVWDILSRENKKSISAFVPVTYPPKEIDGFMISGFLTPTVKSEFTYPPELKSEVLKWIGGEEKYIIDVYDYRRIPPKKLYKMLLEKAEHDFKIVGKLLEKKWDFFMTVIMSVDRAQHTLWKFFDKEHPRYVEDTELCDGLLNIYRRIDEHLGEIIDMLPDDVNYIIISDHGAKRMYSRINANEILIREGFLKLKKYPKKPLPIKDVYNMGYIDMRNSDAFALGAYVAQIFINTKRKPLGKVSEEEYLAVRNQIADIFREVRGENGEKLDNRIIFREEAYRGEKIHVMPDITVYFDNLHYGSNEMIGFSDMYSLETVKGADDSNHGEYGIFIMSGPNIPKRLLKNIKLEDLAPTILDLMNVDIPQGLDGRSMLR